MSDLLMRQWLGTDPAMTPDVAWSPSNGRKTLVPVEKVDNNKNNKLTQDMMT